jgi:acetoin utilization deacetylase AcuC-like enzyme
VAAAPPGPGAPAAAPGPTAFVSHSDCSRHDTGWQHPDHQGRLPALVRAVYRDMLTLFDRLLEVEARHASVEDLLLAHTPAYVESVRLAAEAAERAGSPQPFTAEAVVSGASWDAARAAAGSVLTGIDAVLAGAARNAFCSARPPGAMAMRDRSLGFALFNNVAVGALDLLRRRGVERVLVVEIADRAGLGIAEILGPERGVRLLSVHREDERPRDWAGARVAARVVAPFRAGAGAEEVGEALRLGLERALDGHAPEIVLLSLGLDTLAGDPLGGLALLPDDLHPLTAGLRDLAADLCGGRLVSVLDAGYHPQASALAVVQHLRALAGLAPA